MNKLFFLTVALLFPFLIKAQGIDDCIVDTTTLNITLGGDNRAINCSNNIPSQSSQSYQDKYSQMSYWIPDEATPIKTIKIAFHVFNDDNGDGTIFLNNAQGITDIELTVERLNDVYSNVAEPTNPKQGVDELIDTKIRFSLEEIYFYDDDTFNTCLPSSFSVRSNMLNYIINNHPERLEYLPILIGEFNCKPPHANLPSPSFLGSSSNLDMMSYNFMGPSSLWSASRTLTHELGHNLDLRHTYVPGETCNQSSQEYLSDFFDSSLGGGTDCLHDAGWDCDIEDASNTCTNNIMGGVNKTLYYFSPLQIGRIHRALSIKSVRKYIKDSPYASDAPLVVDQNELWDFDIQLYQDILVETGNTLTITCRVAMPEQAKIIVEPGAKLIIDGGVVTTFCENTFWQGIEVWGNHNLPQTEANQGVVELKNEGIIEYARNGIRAIKRLSSGYDWSKTGGIVRCMSGTFKDCRRGIDNV